MPESNAGNTKKRHLSSPDSTDLIIPENGADVKVTSKNPSTGPVKDAFKAEQEEHGKHKVKAAKVVDEKNAIATSKKLDFVPDNKSGKNQSKNIITAASSGLTASTQRIGLKNADESSSPSPTKPSTRIQSESILTLPDPLDVAALKSNTPDTSSSFKGRISSFSSASGFAKFSSAPLASFSSTNPDPSSTLPTTSSAKKSPVLSSPAKSLVSDSKLALPIKSTLPATSIKPFSFGSGKGTFGTGSATFGYASTTISAFGSKNKSEKEDEEEEEEGDDDAYQGYLEEQKKKYEIQEVVTGEEGEELVANVRCKLYVEDPVDNLSDKSDEKNRISSSSSGWKERGVGVLKLSQMNDGKHRLVMRSDIVRKVILNIRIHHGMPIQVRNERYIEFYAAGDSSLLNHSHSTSSTVQKDGKALGLVKYLVRCKNSDVTEEFYASVKEVINK